MPAGQREQADRRADATTWAPSSKPRGACERPGTHHPGQRARHDLGRHARYAGGGRRDPRRAGNALHGTTPLHLFDASAPELPAIVYVSEVSHLDGDDAYVFAAGYYVDRILGNYQLRAMAGRDASALERTLQVDTAPDGAIHYYCILRSARQAGVAVGDTVVFCFRPQTFVTRARTQADRRVCTARARQDLRPRYDEEARLIDGVS